MTTREMLCAAVLLVGCLAPSARSQAAPSPRGGERACVAAPGRSGSPDWVRGLGRRLAEDRQASLAPGRLVGFVTDAAGNPLVGAAVTMRSGAVPVAGDTGSKPQRAASVDRFGRFVIDSIDRKEYVLSAFAIGFERQWIEYRGVRGLSDTLCIVLRARPMILAPTGTGSARKPPA